MGEIWGEIKWVVVLLHAGLLRVGLRDVPDEHGADAVGPLARLH